MHRLHRVLLVALVTLMALSALAMPTAAAPGPDATGPLLQTKADRKAEAEAKKAEKERQKCEAKGNWPCSPTVTVEWLRGPFTSEDRACAAKVSVTGFPPGTYFMDFVGITGWSVTVGPDGTGTGLTYDPDRPERGASGVGLGLSVTVTVDGVTSDPSTSAC